MGSSSPPTAPRFARHPRSYEPGDMVCDPRHCLALIEIKPGALDQAAPLCLSVCRGFGDRDIAR